MRSRPRRPRATPACAAGTSPARCGARTAPWPPTSTTPAARARSPSPAAPRGCFWSTAFWSTSASTRPAASSRQAITGCLLRAASTPASRFSTTRRRWASTTTTRGWRSSIFRTAKPTAAPCGRPLPRARAAIARCASAPRTITTARPPSSRPSTASRMWAARSVWALATTASARRWWSMARDRCVFAARAGRRCWSAPSRAASSRSRTAPAWRWQT